MRFAGLDVHKRETEAVILDAGGQVLHRERIATSRSALQAFGRRHLGPDVRVALEATTNTWGVVDILEPFAAEIVPSNPLRTRAIAEAKVKTDKVDALVLAQLLRCDYLPRVWRPDPQTRAMRHQTTRRACLVSERTRLKNRLHAILHQRLIQPPVNDLFSPKGLQWLCTLELDPLGRAALDSDLRLLGHVEDEIATHTAHLARDGYRNDRVRLLMTLPGVDLAVASALVATLGDVDRFRDADHAASYLGLVPSTQQSGDHCYHGPITKHGNSHARWLLVQAAQHLDRHPGPLGVFFRRLASRKNRNVAVVATARKLVLIAWHMLKNNEPYRYAQPKTVQAKLGKLRVAATGRKRRGGNPKGAPRPQTYGSGRRTKAIPALDEAYAAEQLPPTRPLSPGERRVLRDSGLEPFVRDIHTPTRQLKNRGVRAGQEETKTQ
jgi:transposase